MKLPSFLEKISPQRGEEKEYFLVLEIKNREIKGAVWQKEKEKFTIVNLGKRNYSGEWDDAIRAADEVIVDASGGIHQEKIEKVIFGISQTWTAENKIKSPYLANLKKICSKLALKPLGFVVISEAMVNYLKQLEGVPPSVLLIGIEEDSLTLTLAKAGRIEGAKTADRAKKFSEQIEDILLNFSAEVLPARILLYGSDKNLEKLKEALLSHRFSEELPFLHFPKIEILDPDFDIKALAATSGAQMGGVIVEEALLESEPEKETESQVEGRSEIEKEAKEEIEAFGFVKDRDILEEAEKLEEEAVSEEEKEEKEEISRPDPAGEPRLSSMLSPAKTVRLPSLPSLKLPGFSLPQFDMSFLGQIKWIVFSLILIFSVFGGGFFAAYWYLPKSEVKIWVQTKPLGDELEVVFSSGHGGEGGDGGEISGKEIEAEEQLSEKTASTGKKVVGDPARGEIVIYNRTENEKKFAKGTVLTGPKNFNFTLDEEVTVASTSAFSTSFLSVKGRVTAAKIGTEGNVGAGENFAFKDFPTSSYFAKNETDFSGGTSQEVLVIAKADQEKLLSALSEKLTEKAKESLRGKLGPDEKLLEEKISSEVKEKKFDKEIGAEASELSLTLTMTFKAPSYNEKDLKEKLLEKMQGNIPPGYELKREETEINITVGESEGEQTKLKVVGRTNLLPKLDSEKIRKEITGKSKSAAEKYIKDAGSVTQVEIINKFPIPIGLQSLPHLPQNIKIEIIST
ncbi:MAG: hypothetical protein Q8P89_02165 [bacterium]|nr:hypothetical protein [bacterium]